jgi:predicted dehydrogenase
MKNIVRVGLVGANKDRGWASATHLPALAALPGFELRAVSTTRMESARASADQYGAAHAFDNGDDLVALDDIDLVAVSVKAPDHFPVVAAAIRAGKPVLCEWPLGRSVEEARDLLAMAQAAGVPHFLMLQGRASAPLRHAATLIAQGYLGKILSADLHSFHPQWGPEMPAGNAYLLDARNGGTLASIIGGHLLDMLWRCVGPLDLLHGFALNRYSATRVAGIEGAMPKTSPDQYLALGRLAEGGALSLHLQGGICGPDEFALTLWGEKGTLRIEGNHVPEIMPPRLSGTQDRSLPLAPIEVPAALWSIPEAIRSTPAANVAEIYQGVAAALRGEAYDVPDFAHGLRLKEMIFRVSVID